MATTTRVHHLPPETLGNIISFLPQADLKNLRLVDHRFSPLATQRLFRRTRLLARAKDNNDPQRFIQLANSELSGLVSEVSCDVSSIVYNGFYYIEKDQFEFLPVFWDALPLLARFRNIQTLHLCFDASFALRDFKSGSSQFRSRVLKTVLRILMGTFTKEVPKPIDTLSSASIEISPSDAPASPITLSTLIISNLGDYHDPELTNMPEFKRAMRDIKALRLDIAQHKGMWRDWAFTESTAIPNQCQEMFTQLPLTWLSSTVAANLQVLSLHYQSYWGWFPNTDIRRIGGGNGMPKLRSLSLGRFVFSHQSETDGRDLFSTAKIVGEVDRTCLWWHEIIWQIRNSMLNLKRFCIVRPPDLSYHYRNFRKVKGHGDSELSSDEESSHEPSLWQQFINLSEKTLWSCETTFQHFTCATSPKLCLESDAFLCSRSGPSTSFIESSSGYNYVSHDPTQMEQASYNDARAFRAGQIISDMEKLAKIEVIILHSMLSKKSKKQYIDAEKLRLAPKMGTHDTNEYMTGVLRPLLTYPELSLVGATLFLSDFRQQSSP
ncbi:hypothetical protein FGLOB1_1016 [Fusarium globosum]|uniref:F-box domain-containing protein n=1 Tax=Fusarium globosum TaxID=78864 RepID=A0A8H6DJB4_9HYPO|nr:hypothetical protein FGLOB1_1016 [Fusarium globosum]